MPGPGGVYSQGFLLQGVPGPRGVPGLGGACSWGVGVPGPRGVPGPGGCLILGGAWSQGVVFQHALRQIPPVNRMTDRCKNIAFATSLRTVITPHTLQVSKSLFESDLCIKA